MRRDWQDWLVISGIGVLAAALLYVAEPKGWQHAENGSAHSANDNSRSALVAKNP